MQHAAAAAAARQLKVHLRGGGSPGRQRKFEWMEEDGETPLVAGRHYEGRTPGGTAGTHWQLAGASCTALSTHTHRLETRTLQV